MYLEIKMIKKNNLNSRFQLYIKKRLLINSL